MKKLILTLSVIALTVSSCKKEKSIQDQKKEPSKPWVQIQENTNYFTESNIDLRVRTINCSGVVVNIGGFTYLNDTTSLNLDTVISVTSQKTYNVQSSCSGSNILIEKRTK